MNDNPIARWAVLILVASMMFFAYMFVDVMSPLKSTIEKAVADGGLGWNSSVFGTYAASEYFLNVFCLFLIFAGIILDKMGVRFTGLLSAGLVGSSAGKCENGLSGIYDFRLRLRDGGNDSFQGARQVVQRQGDGPRYGP